MTNDLPQNHPHIFYVCRRVVASGSRIESVILVHALLTRVVEVAGGKLSQGLKVEGT